MPQFIRNSFINWDSSSLSRMKAEKTFPWSGCEADVPKMMILALCLSDNIHDTFKILLQIADFQPNCLYLCSCRIRSDADFTVH